MCATLLTSLNISKIGMAKAILLAKYLIFCVRLAKYRCVKNANERGTNAHTPLRIQAESKLLSTYHHEMSEQFTVLQKILEVPLRPPQYNLYAKYISLKVGTHTHTPAHTFSIQPFVAPPSSLSKCPSTLLLLTF